MDLDARISDFVVKNGRGGFTNRQIREYFKNHLEFKNYWSKYKSRARYHHKNGQNAMFYEDGKYYYFY